MSGLTTAEYFGLKNNDIVRVRIQGEKAVILENVKVRVKENFKLQLHLDTDDANASDAVCNKIATLIVKH